MNPEVERSPTEVALKMLEREDGVYSAGYPGYRGNFTRDSIYYALLAGDEQALAKQVAYSTRHMGKKADSRTGEERGKAHHEIEQVEINGLLTTYNACDTTALFLIGAHELGKDNPDVYSTLSRDIKLGVSYVKKHLDNGIFYEDPRWCGAKGFALKVTFWKDSVLNGARSEPTYPVAYALPHFQNASAIIETGNVFDDNELRDLGAEMFERGIAYFWQTDHFVSSIDGEKEVCDYPSSDSLHSLLFIPPEFLSKERASKIAVYSRKLLTPYGYAAGVPGEGNQDNYHTANIWPFEQAIINWGARLHGLREVENESRKVYPLIADDFPEIICAKNHNPAGNNPQLWTIGARQYFQHNGVT